MFEISFACLTPVVLKHVTTTQVKRLLFFVFCLNFLTIAGLRNGPFVCDPFVADVFFLLLAGNGNLACQAAFLSKSQSLPRKETKRKHSFLWPPVYEGYLFVTDN